MSMVQWPRVTVASGTGVRVYGCRTDELMNTDACTLPTAERPYRLAEFDSRFSEAVRSVEREVTRCGCT